ncbi:MAG: T9SS type A sorting domain-containing protein [Lewinella sp.]|nr:T9SS type A sorting domain-containing protein [Lewinella sp.]
MRLYLSILLTVLTFGLAAQSIRPADLVASQQQHGTAFIPFQPFVAAPEQRAAVKELDPTTNFQVLDIHPEQRRQWLLQAPSNVRLQVPAWNKTTYSLMLVKVDPFTDDFSINTSTDGPLSQPNRGLHYRGTVAGDPHSLVAISVFPEEIMGFISTEKENLVIGRLQGDDWRSGQHIIYDDDQLMRELGVDCGTFDDGTPYTISELREPPTGSRDLSDCVRLYYEVDFDIFLSKGGMNGTINFISGIHNQIATMYANELINTLVSEVFIWSNQSPYTGGSSSNMLSQFQSQTNNFNGNLGQLFSYQSSGGIAATINGMCSSNENNRQCFSSIGSTYAAVPTYSWTVDVATHEFGHLFGSRHTHACVWNGNGTAIDGCSGSTEGSCPLPGDPPEGGTVMSYCHLSSVGKNFSLGFGPQPGAVIRNVVDNAGCLAACAAPSCEDNIQNGDETGVDCGGPDCPVCPTCDDGIMNGDEEGVDCGGPNCPDCPCFDNPVTLTIVLDNYPEETTWNITDDQGNFVAFGGPYDAFPDGSTVTDNICLTDGCYTFHIFDSFGDGICCGFGFGSYSLTDSDGVVLASGGNFGSSESTPFCVEGVTATCNDGIQNGDETGVDCGGRDCPPCGVDPTCDDGIMNGDETGVDCGGPDCPVCPTCDDGIMNGNETDVDCGGPDCVPCNPLCPDEVFITSDDFETSLGSWTDGGSDCSRYADANYAASGTYSIRLRDNSSSSYTSTNPLFVSPYETLLLNFTFYPRSMENGDRFVLDLSIDGGNNFTIVRSWDEGVDFTNDVFYTEDVSIPGPFSDQTILRFRCDASSNTDWVFIDDISISGCGAGATPTCNDGIQNGDETGVDCGGSNCPTCPTCDDGIQNGEETGVDCGGPDCPACPTCNDGIQNGDETGVDCGGPDCPACPTCDDGIQNGNETGVDCGGPDCAPCEADPTCDDGIQNGNETGVDCGGPDCAPCEADPTCDDGIQNGNETGVDCGGPDCAPCVPDPTCDDGIQNGDETGVDCGGPDCPACPTCSDGIQNGSETGVDCGGPDCIPCDPNGGDCTTVTIDSQNFETGLGIWNDGGSDCSLYLAPEYASSGQYSVRLRDNSSSSVTYTDLLDWQVYEEVTVNFSFLCRSMDDPSEGFSLMLSTDGGFNFTTIQSWRESIDFANDVPESESVVLSGPFTDQVVLQFMGDGSSNTDWVHLDDVIITGCVNAAQQIQPKQSPPTAEAAPAFIQSTRLFPNPATDQLQVSFLARENGWISLQVTDLAGRQVYRAPVRVEAGEFRTSIDVKDFGPGIYQLHLISSEGWVTERFVVLQR